jgi:hypothetical protein
MEFSSPRWGLGMIDDDGLLDHVPDSGFIKQGFILRDSFVCHDS